MFHNIYFKIKSILYIYKIIKKINSNLPIKLILNKENYNSIIFFKKIIPYKILYNNTELIYIKCNDKTIFITYEYNISKFKYKYKYINNNIIANKLSSLF